METDRKTCPGCGFGLEADDLVCAFCGRDLSAREETKLVRVFVADSPMQASLIRSVLAGARVTAFIPSEGKALLIPGVDSVEYREGYPVEVPSSLADRAYEVLCANGIACRVEEGEVERVWADRIGPAVQGGGGEAPGIVAVLELNKKEVVQRIASRLVEEAPRFLEAVLLEACRQGKARLASTIAGEMDEAGVEGLVSKLAALSDGRARAVAATAIARLERHERDALRALAGLLEDPDEEVRSEAIEGLFSLTGEDLGYEPDAPPEARTSAVRRWAERLGIEKE